MNVHLPAAPFPHLHYQTILLHEETREGTDSLISYQRSKAVNPNWLYTDEQYTLNEQNMLDAAARCSRCNFPAWDK